MKPNWLGLENQLLYSITWVMSGIKKRRRVILRNTKFLLKKLPPSSTIRFTLIFMTRTIPLRNIDILLWGNRPLGVANRLVY